MESLNNLFQDKSINIVKQGSFLFSDLEQYKDKKIHVFEYKPRISQPCYTNTRNNFLTGKDNKDYLKESYGVNKNLDGELFIKPIFKQSDFDNNSNLVSWKNKSIVFNSKLNTPIRIEVSLVKNDDKYSLRSDLNYYSWGKKNTNLFHIKKLDLKVLRKESVGKKNNLSFSIIDPQTWVSKVRSKSVGVENFDWYREFDFVEVNNLQKDSFDVELHWEVMFPNRKDQCCLKFKTIL